MSKSNIIFGSILIGLGLLYALVSLGLMGDAFFVMAFVALIIVAPIITEHFNDDGNKEFIVKAIFTGSILLATLVDLGLVFNLIMSGVIVLGGIAMMYYEKILKK